MTIKLEDIKDQAGFDAAIKSVVDEAVSGLVNKNAELLGKLDKAKRTAAPDNLDELLAAQGKLKELETADLEKNQEYKKLLDNSKAQHEEAMGALQGKLKAEQGITKNLLVNEGLAKSLGKHNVNPVLLDAAISILSADVSVIDVDGKRVAQVGDKGLDSFVKDWANTDVGKNFVLAPANGGGGAGGNGNNGSPSEHEVHFKSDTWNLTKQGALLKSDPDAYAILHKQYPSKAGQPSAS